MKIVNIGFVLVCASLTSSCASLYIAEVQKESSGLIGCHPNEIEIESHDFSGHTWTAVCKNTKFYCSKSDELINCKEAM